MFKKLLMLLKGGLYRLGLLKGIQDITEHKDVSNHQQMFNYIETWKALYKGYHPEWHKIEYMTLDGEKTRDMATLNMAKTVSQEMASLVFNEKCKISIGNEALSETIEVIFKNNKFNKKFQDHVEYSFAHGGMVIKPYVENKKILLSFVTADCFIPISWQNETIIEAVFPNEIKKGDKKYTHLEWHLRSDSEKGMGYTIKNELYESKGGGDLGVKVPLSTLFPNLDDEVGIHPLEKPLFSYFKPNTANNKDIESPLGISIFANALDTMKSIDTAFDSFLREFRLGKKKIIVPAHMVKTVVDPESGVPLRYYDSTDETYEAFGGDSDSNEIKDISIELRVEEHIGAINALLNLFAMQTGFSAGTFSFDGESVKTATEVVSENSKTFKSKKSHEIILESGLQDLIESIVSIGVLYKLFPQPSEYEVTVTFDDSIVEDNAAEQARQIQLVNAKLQSKKRAIMKIHGLTEEDAEELLKEINEENKTATAESIDFFGGRGS